MMCRALVIFCVITACLFGSTSALAGVTRFAVVIGNNLGTKGDAPLRYAEADAQKLRDVLRDLGGFAAINVTLLEGEDADDVRKAIIAVNERVRQVVAAPDEQAVLVVYYSGHADSTHLHLGNTKLELRELEQLVRGSSANFRLLVVDACRSGALTRVKGGSKAPPVAIRADLSVAEQGAVFLTASAAGEDAQESDALKGSFFTHFFVSGLRGAADADADGLVTVDEAYEHAYEATLRETSAGSVGLQHPTFRMETRGRTSFVLTTPGLVSARAGKLVFPPGKSYLVLARTSGGPVIGEVGEKSSARALTVRPGKYFVRARAADYLLEGTVEVTASSTVDVKDDLLSKTAYARLVRKGAGVLQLSHGPRVGYGLRTGVVDGSSLCHGFVGGYAVAQAYVEITPQIAYCRADFGNERVDADQEEIGGVVSGAYVFDIPVVSFSLGVQAGVALLHESFVTRGLTPPDRNTAAGRVGIVGGVSVDVVEGFYVDVRAAAEAMMFELEKDGRSDVTTRFAVRPSFGFGQWY